MTPRYDANLDKWYVAGVLSYDGSPARNGIVRINNDGSLDTIRKYIHTTICKTTSNKYMVVIVIWVRLSF